MVSRTLAAVATAIALLLPLANFASAADIYYDDRPRVGSPYDDPRYRDLYGRDYKTAPPAPPRYVDLPPPTVYTDRVYRERRGYLPPMPPPAYVDRREWLPDRTSSCLPREEIRRGLQQDGWSGFHDLDFRGDIATVLAYRPDGRLYRLKIERCSGDLIGTRLVDRNEHAYSAYEYAPSDSIRGPRYQSNGTPYEGSRAYRY
jgi:hypothetical protein